MTKLEILLTMVIILTGVAEALRPDPVAVIVHVREPAPLVDYGNGRTINLGNGSYLRSGINSINLCAPSGHLFIGK